MQVILLMELNSCCCNGEVRAVRIRVREVLALKPLPIALRISHVAHSRPYVSGVRIPISERLRAPLAMLLRSFGVVVQA